mmetsp:Transcript_21528/g.54244  ORF Transcript_21528/g.54244 Transcript_21528/m.54244 type:complete len:205 (+) Transcript_21528:430-1044(+)
MRKPPLFLAATTLLRRPSHSFLLPARNATISCTSSTSRAVRNNAGSSFFVAPVDVSKNSITCEGSSSALGESIILPAVPLVHPALASELINKKFSACPISCAIDATATGGNKLRMTMASGLAFPVSSSCLSVGPSTFGGWMRTVHGRKSSCGLEDLLRAAVGVRASNSRSADFFQRSAEEATTSYTTRSSLGSATSVTSRKLTR